MQCPICRRDLEQQYTDPVTHLGYVHGPQAMAALIRDRWPGMLQACPVCAYDFRGGEGANGQFWFSHVAGHDQRALAAVVWRAATQDQPGEVAPPMIAPVSAFCPICEFLVSGPLADHLTQHKRRYLADWIAEYANAPGELEAERKCYQVLEGENRAALAIIRSLQGALDAAQTEAAGLWQTLAIAQQQRDAAQSEAANAGARAALLQHKLEVLGETAYQIANPDPGARMVQCALCGLWVSDLTIHLAEYCEELNPNPGEGGEGPQGRPLPSVDNTPAGGEEMAPITAVQIPSPAFDLLNALAWYVRNATQPDGETGYTQGGGLLAYGPAHKLLEALDRYIHATNHGEGAGDWDAVAAQREMAAIDQDRDYDRQLEDDQVPF